MALDGVLNDNKEHIHKGFFFPFLRIFSIYSKINCQNYQNNPLSSDPHLYR
jgi:hypothetical protein